jgi:hypothetical protein
VLDPANYGSLTITGPVSIEGHGWASIAPVAGQAAITITAPGASDKINIIGVVLDGTAISGASGIVFTSGGSLTVRDSVIRNFQLNGISFNPSTSTPTHLYVSNTLVSDNGNSGISLTQFSNMASTTNAALYHVEMENNGTGLFVNTNTQTFNVTVSDSISANNIAGIVSNSMNGTPANIMVRNSTIANNSQAGLEAGENGALIAVTRPYK